MFDLIDFLLGRSPEESARRDAEREREREREWAMHSRCFVGAGTDQSRDRDRRAADQDKRDRGRKADRLRRLAAEARAKAAQCPSCGGSKAKDGGGFWCCRPLIADAERYERQLAQL